MRTTKTAAAGALAAGLLLGFAQPVHADNIGNQGCTPGYWKNHTSSWEEYRPTQTIGSVFSGAPKSHAQLTLQQALSLRGGSGATGASDILLRAATAAVLNAAHEGLGYPYRRFGEPFQILSQVNAALASGDRTRMLSLAATLDAANNLGCPLR